MCWQFSDKSIFLQSDIICIRKLQICHIFTKVAVLECYTVPAIYLQGEHCLLCYHSEVFLQKRYRNCLLSNFRKIQQLYDPHEALSFRESSRLLLLITKNLIWLKDVLLGSCVYFLKPDFFYAEIQKGNHRKKVLS